MYPAHAIEVSPSPSDHGVQSCPVRPTIHGLVLTPEIGEFAEEVRRIFAELGRFGESLAGECSPPVDVYETDEAVQVTMDLPGVSPEAVRVIAKGNALLIAGEKASRRGRGDSSFHLVERGYGRFARSIRLSAPCDPARARAELVDGELRVTIPRIAERRGRGLAIPVQTPSH